MAEPLLVPESDDPRRAALSKLASHLHAAVDVAIALLTPQESKPAPVGLLRYAEAAERLACDPTHVARLAKRGVLDLVLLGEASPRVTIASVERLIERGGVRTSRRRPTLLERISR